MQYTYVSTPGFSKLLMTVQLLCNTHLTAMQYHILHIVQGKGLRNSSVEHAIDPVSEQRRDKLAEKKKIPRALKLYRLIGPNDLVC